MRSVVSEAHPLPGVAAVGRLVEAVADRDAVAGPRLAGAHPDLLGVLGIDGDGADRLVVVVEDRLEDEAAVGRLPDAAAGRADIDGERILAPRRRSPRCGRPCWPGRWSGPRCRRRCSNRSRRPALRAAGGADQQAGWPPGRGSNGMSVAYRSPWKMTQWEMGRVAQRGAAMRHAPLGLSRRIVTTAGASREPRPSSRRPASRPASRAAGRHGEAGGVEGRIDLDLGDRDRHPRRALPWPSLDREGEDHAVDRLEVAERRLALDLLAADVDLAGLLDRPCTARRRCRR